MVQFRFLTAVALSLPMAEEAREDRFSRLLDGTARQKASSGTTRPCGLPAGLGRGRVGNTGPGPAITVACLEEESLAPAARRPRARLRPAPAPTAGPEEERPEPPATYPAWASCCSLREDPRHFPGLL